MSVTHESPPPGTEPGSCFEPGMAVDHYRIVRLVGRGGMGEVYLARDTQLGRRVALKVVHADRMGSAEAVDRFKLEARTTAQFAHPHIVAIHGVGDLDGRPYVALEYLKGENLRERIGGGLPGSKEVARIGLAIAEALEEAHSHGVLHRDLKPENVVIPEDGRLRVLDFGLAKAFRGAKAWRPDPEEDTVDGFEPGEARESFHTHGRRLCGTPMYMAPEQWEEAPLSGATDIWALGLILYELVVGHRPYRGKSEDPYSVAYKVCGPEPVPPAQALRDVPGDLADVVFHCLEKEPQDRPTATEVADALRGVLTPARARFAEEEGPYRGLQAFTERHAGYFFGRDVEVARFLERLRTEPVLPVVGPSGGGKSSFVQAGVIPRLREQGAWTILSLRPGSHPFTTLAQRLLSGESTQRYRSSRQSVPTDANQESTFQLSQQPTASVKRPPDSEDGEPIPYDMTLESEDDVAVLAEQLRQSPRLLNLELTELAERDRGRVLLFVDQLEELYSLVRDEDVRARFMKALVTAADDPQGPVRVVFTLRDDFLGRLAVGAEVREALGRVTVIRSPQPEALREILTRPLELVGHSFDEPGLVDRMLGEVRAEPAALPLLQFAARTLWDRRDRGRSQLTREAYDTMGGVGGALAEHAQAVLDGLTPAQTRTARQLLLRLVTPDRTRRTLSAAEAVEGLGEAGDEVLSRLAGSRLVTTRKGRDGSEADLELVHESLIAGWSRLARWIDESRDELAFLAEVGQATRLWERRGRRLDEVWTGEALDDARRGLSRLTGPAPGHIREFVEAGELQERRAQQRQRVVTLVGIAMLALIAVVSVAAAVGLATKEREARAQRRAAEHGQSEAQLEGARAALMRGDLLEARAKLRGALELENSAMGRALWWTAAGEPLLWRKPLGTIINDVTFTPDGETAIAALGDRSIYLFDVTTRDVRFLRGHRDQVYAVDVSPDGTTLASGSWSGELWIWDLETGTSHALAGHDGGINFLAHSPDGRLLATGSDDHSVRVWDLAGDRAPLVLEGHQDRVYGVAFSPDGSLLASGSRDGSVILWEPRQGDLIQRLDDHTSGVSNLAFDPAGGLLAAAGADATIRLWRVPSGEPAGVLSGHQSKVWDLDFSPDGASLASAGRDGAIRVWDITGQAPARTLTGHEGAVYAIRYSPRGGLLISGGADHVLRVWDLARGSAQTGARGHSALVLSVAFDPAGERIASGGGDHTIRLWDVTTGAQQAVLEGHGKTVTSLDFGPGGAPLVSSSRDHTVRVWSDALDGRHSTLTAHTSFSNGVILTTDGTRAVSVGGDASARVWDATTWEPLLSYEGHTDTINAVAIAANDRTVATSGYDREIHVWDLRTGRRITTLQGHTSVVRGVSFHPDGRQLASASDDGTVRLFDTTAGTSRVLGEVDARVYGAVFSPDGSRIGTPLSDGTALIWDVTRGEQVVLTGHRSEVNGLAFSPDGLLVVTGSDDQTVRLWDASTGHPVWRAPLMLRSPAQLRTHHGWIALDTGLLVEGPPGAWPAELGSALRAAISDDGSTLCALGDDGQLAAWDLGHDERLFRVPRIGAVQVLALPDACVTLGREDGGVAHLDTRAGARIRLSGDARAITLDRGEILVATADRVLSFDTAGEMHTAHDIGAGVTAMVRTGDWFVLGFGDGNLELHPIGGDEDRPAFPFEDVPSSPVVSLLEGPMEILVVGYASGDLGLWNVTNGARLHGARLHGPVGQLMIEGGKLYAASDLGDHLVLDLSSFDQRYCDLMQGIWAEVPVVWEGGLPVTREPPVGHACGGD
jgi:WD40 repeat protein/serine/threonine protein kinase